MIGWAAAATAEAPQAQSRAVIWLDHAATEAQGGDGAARAERARALRLELQARNYVLLESRPGDRGAPPDHAAMRLLARTTAAAVVWLEADGERPVSWLLVRVRQRLQPVKSPLPHPPAAIDAQLLAIAAASLLDQALRDSQAVPAAVPTPAQAAALAPSPPPAPAATDRTLRAPLPEAPPRDYFVQLAFALPFAYVTPGMEASSRPEEYEVFVPFRPGSGFDRRYFDDLSAYVPDADSFDDYEEVDPRGNVIVARGTTPVSTACAADGIETRAPELPSKYCVRVQEPGFEIVPALRLSFGAWVLPELALSAFYQWHFAIEAVKPLGAHALGVQGEYLVAGQRERGLSLALLGALSVGRNETPVSVATNAAGTTVNGLSGLFLAKTGLSLRHAIRRFGAVVGSVSLGGRFPESQLEMELSLGVEHGL